jgi:hypothetical protein
MKVAHLPSVLRHYPGFVLRHGRRMLAHTFRGSTWRSVVGLETERNVFRRYKAIRAAEREYVPERIDWSSGSSSAHGPAEAGPYRDADRGAMAGTVRP